MDEATYKECISRLDAAGAGSPPGRLYHVCFGDPNNLRVSDIWDSKENFDKFAETLKPIMQDLGIVGEPEVLETHNIIVGERAASATQ